MDTAGQSWTEVWSQFRHFLVIFVGEGIAVGFVGSWFVNAFHFYVCEMESVDIHALFLTTICSLPTP